MPDFLSLLSSMDTVFKTGRDFVGFLSDVKSFLGKAEQAPNMMQMPQQGAAWQMPVMQPFQPQFHDPFGGGQQWLPQLQQMAGQNGNPWVPTQVHDLGGINLTGVWCPPMNPMDQTYIRQFGP